MFRPMKKEDVLKALEGHENILKKATEENEAFFGRLSCPECRGAVMPIVNTKQLYREGGILPNYLAKCRACTLEFEPYTGIIVTRAKLSTP